MILISHLFDSENFLDSRDSSKTEYVYSRNCRETLLILQDYLTRVTFGRNISDESKSSRRKANRT